VRSHLVLAATLALLSGCRLSAPVYAFRSLKASEPTEPGNSLVFGSLELASTFGGIDTIMLRRVSPSAPGALFPSASERKIFRVFRPRHVKDGHFLVEVPPGAYELVALQGGIWGQDALFTASPDAQLATRVVVARPGVYDVGVVKLDPGAFSARATMSFEGRGGPERRQILRDAIAGTGWTRFLQDAK
jgi:hypothetical protein